MFIDSIEYSQFEGTQSEWNLEGFTLGQINLIVGQNATGKSRSLNIISSLANMFSGERLLVLSGSYKVKFNNKGSLIDYTVKYEKSRILEERLDIDSQNRLIRGENGTGKIYYAELEDQLDFQAALDRIAVFAKRDSIQHPFLEDLYVWGKSIRHYYFGTPLGKDRFAVFIKTPEGERPPDLNPKDTNQVVNMVRKGKEDFPEIFEQSIINEMKLVGYNITAIGVSPLISIIFEPNMPQPEGLFVQEEDLGAITDQNDMSQGMFRVLSLITQITYSELTGRPSCILIDDIGEGLDYERSSALVKLLIDKVNRSPVQLIMATNDRFVMNNVPLEYWSIIRRIGSRSIIYNYRNSPKMFDEFQLTGLNNFDLFSSGYYLEALSEE